MHKKSQCSSLISRAPASRSWFLNLSNLVRGSLGSKYSLKSFSCFSLLHQQMCSIVSTSVPPISCVPRSQTLVGGKTYGERCCFPRPTLPAFCKPLSSFRYARALSETGDGRETLKISIFLLNLSGQEKVSLICCSTGATDEMSPRVIQYCK